MMKADEIFERLTKLREKTASAVNIDSGGFWVGDVAGERRVMDDLHAQRLTWRMAHRCACLGLEQLEHGETDLAEGMWLMATDYFIAALESRIRIEDIQALSTSAKRRGTKSKSDRDMRLAAAVDATGLSGKAARAAALAANPDLATEFKGMGDPGLAEAVRRARKKS